MFPTGGADKRSAAQAAGASGILENALIPADTDKAERIHQQPDVKPQKTSQPLIMQTAWIDTRKTALIYSSRLPETTLETHASMCVCVCVSLLLR